MDQLDITDITGDVTPILDATEQVIGNSAALLQNAVTLIGRLRLQISRYRRWKLV